MKLQVIPLAQDVSQASRPFLSQMRKSMPVKPNVIAYFSPMNTKGREDEAEPPDNDFCRSNDGKSRDEVAEQFGVLSGTGDKRPQILEIELQIWV